MLHTQENPVVVPAPYPLTEERPVPAMNLMQFRQAVSAVLAEQESDNEILRVLDRAADNDSFITDLTYRGSKALEGYQLTLNAKAALLSGDIRWIEARVGRLDARLRTWPDCRLQQEIW